MIHGRKNYLHKSPPTDKKKKENLFTTHHDFKWAVCMRGLHGRSSVLARKVEAVSGGNASMFWLHRGVWLCRGSPQVRKMRQHCPRVCSL